MTRRKDPRSRPSRASLVYHRKPYADGRPRIRYRPGFMANGLPKPPKVKRIGVKQPYKPCPQKSRFGVPHGMHRAQAHALRREAEKKADQIVAEHYEDQVIVPGSDEEKGAAALKELCIIALAPGDVKTKVAAARSVLEWTKAKPAQKQDVKISTAEQWLADVIADSKKQEKAE